MVLMQAPAKCTLAVVSTRSEVGGESPLLVKTAVAWHLLHGVLVPIRASDTRAFLSSMSVLVNQSITKVAVYVTIRIVIDLPICVRLLESERFLVQVGLEVGIPEGETEGADVGGPGRQLSTIGGDRDHGDDGPRVGDGVTRAGSVLRHRGEAWR